MFLVLSILHLGDIKQGGRREARGARGGAGRRASSTTGADPALAAARLHAGRGAGPAARSSRTRSSATNARLRRREDPGAAGQPDGGRRPQHHGAQDRVDPDPGRACFMGLAFILMQVKSPMLVERRHVPADRDLVRHLPGRHVQGHPGEQLEKRKIEGPAKERADNTGTLLASGLIAGEALIGILFAALAFAEIGLFEAFDKPSYLLALAGILALGAFLVARAVRAAKARTA